MKLVCQLSARLSVNLFVRLRLSMYIACQHNSFKTVKWILFKLDTGDRGLCRCAWRKMMLVCQLSVNLCVNLFVRLRLSMCIPFQHNSFQTVRWILFKFDTIQGTDVICRCAWKKMMLVCQLFVHLSVDLSVRLSMYIPYQHNSLKPFVGFHYTLFKQSLGGLSVRPSPPIRHGVLFRDKTHRFAPCPWQDFY